MDGAEQVPPNSPSQNFERAVRVLDPLDLTFETEAEWMKLRRHHLINSVS